MILASPAQNRNANSVMPAWTAGIQVHKDAFGDIHVSLDSSTPCWNDAVEEALLGMTEAPLSVFSKGTQGLRREEISIVKERKGFHSAFGSFASFLIPKNPDPS
jgi:hypothetical protein